MLTKLIKLEKINIDGSDYEIRYFRNINSNGNTSFTSEVAIGLKDKIILDDDSIGSLKHKVNLILPVSLWSRGEQQILRK
jgi:hypothetical protein